MVAVALLTLAPRPLRSVRLACLIHAANVHSEPGSNPSKVIADDRGLPHRHRRVLETKGRGKNWSLEQLQAVTRSPPSLRDPPSPDAATPAALSGPTSDRIPRQNTPWSAAKQLNETDAFAEPTFPLLSQEDVQPRGLACLINLADDRPDCQRALHCPSTLSAGVW